MTCLPRNAAEWSKKMKKVEKIISIVFFALAGISLVYGIWSIVFFVKDLSSAIDSGQFILSGNEYTIVNYLVTGSIQYIFLAALLFGFGWFFFHRSAAALAAGAADAPTEDADTDLAETFDPEALDSSDTQDDDEAAGAKADDDDADEQADAGEPNESSKGEESDEDAKSSEDEKSGDAKSGKDGKKSGGATASGESDAKIDSAKKDA
jgi:hypothetical protein